MENIKSYVQQNKDRFINELIDLLKMPSVSADPAYSRRYWNFRSSKNNEKDVDFVEICETAYPIVYGENNW
jgi:hypothetical protein